MANAFYMVIILKVLQQWAGLDGVLIPNENHYETAPAIKDPFHLATPPGGLRVCQHFGFRMPTPALPPFQGAGDQSTGVDSLQLEAPANLTAGQIPCHERENQECDKHSILDNSSMVITKHVITIRTIHLPTKTIRLPQNDSHMQPIISPEVPDLADLSQPTPFPPQPIALPWSTKIGLPSDGTRFLHPPRPINLQSEEHNRLHNLVITLVGLLELAILTGMALWFRSLIWVQSKGTLPNKSRSLVDINASLRNVYMLKVRKVNALSQSRKEQLQKLCVTSMLWALQARRWKKLYAESKHDQEEMSRALENPPQGRMSKALQKQDQGEMSKALQKHTTIGRLWKAAYHCAKNGLTNECDELRSDNIEKDAEISKFKRQHTTNSGKILSLQMEKNSTLAEVQRLKRSNEGLKQEREDLKDKLQSINTSLERAEVQESAYEKRLSASTSKASELEIRLRSTTDDKKALKERNAWLEGQFKLHKDCHPDVEFRALQQTHYACPSKADYQALENAYESCMPAPEAEDLKILVENQRNDFAREQKAHKETLAKVEAECTELKVKNEAALQRVDLLQKTNHELTAVNTNSDRSKKLEEENEQLQIQIACDEQAHHEEVARLQEACDILEDGNTQWVEMLQSHQSDRDAAKADAKGAREEVQKVLQDLYEVTKQRDAARTEATNLKTRESTSLADVIPPKAPTGPRYSPTLLDAILAAGEKILPEPTPVESISAEEFQFFERVSTRVNLPKRPENPSTRRTRRGAQGRTKMSLQEAHEAWKAKNPQLAAQLAYEADDEEFESNEIDEAVSPADIPLPSSPQAPVTRGPSSLSTTKPAMSMPYFMPLPSRNNDPSNFILSAPPSTTARSCLGSPATTVSTTGLSAAAPAFTPTAVTAKPHEVKTSPPKPQGSIQPFRYGGTVIGPDYHWIKLSAPKPDSGLQASRFAPTTAKANTPETKAAIPKPSGGLEASRFAPTTTAPETPEVKVSSPKPSGGLEASRFAVTEVTAKTTEQEASASKPDVGLEGSRFAPTVTTAETPGVQASAHKPQGSLGARRYAGTVIGPDYHWIKLPPRPDVRRGSRVGVAPTVSTTKPPKEEASVAKPQGGLEASRFAPTQSTANKPTAPKPKDDLQSLPLAPKMTKAETSEAKVSPAKPNSGLQGSRWAD